MIFNRRRGVAIVDMKKGILVVADKNKIFMLPGGGAKRWESRKKAAMRELYEETVLRTKKINYLFTYDGNNNRSKRNNIRNKNEVFLIKEKGIPYPRNEIKYIDYWKPDKKIKLTPGAKEAIKRYISSI